ncbi:hypothetical protein CPU12_12865 [Malaciobacter molluscorum LMG 25693]|uniref:Signal transduction response regulator n=1 Tax=Malaciobacter molluscorum LMG 25693 TaxID=870501 RepID=A0A2G1DEL8_9BACT|nr:response regulator [Malaciobacter molluscorum]AXX93100.1 signal transduction response regulator [Malaciobacter molluscorum LMG 25693]PHO16933.1 hypothetical protein CPU12_12865 [Malaciobacter molluscorum LMG 25693]
MYIDLKELKTITLLYVEDDEMTKIQTVSVFEKIFKNIYTASNGEEGLELFKEHKDSIDAIIADLNLPKMTGLKMAEKIHKISQSIPIIFTTAYTDEDILLKAISLNIDSYITKPIKIKDLTESILKYVKIYREKQNLYDTTKALASEMKTTRKDYDQLKDKLDFLEKKIDFYRFLSEQFIAYIKLDNFGIIQNISSEFINIYKYDKADLVGRPISTISNNSSNIQRMMLEVLKKKEAIGFEERFITKDKEELIFHNIIYPLYENENNYASGYIIYQSLQR